MTSQSGINNDAQFEDINPDDLHSNEQSSSTKNLPRIRIKALPNTSQFSASASQLLGMLNGCCDENYVLYPTDPFVKNPNPVRLSSYQVYPAQSIGRIKFFCCKDFSQNSLHDLFKAVLEHIYHFILSKDFEFSFLHAESHKKLHRVMEEMQYYLEKIGLLRMYEKIAKTMADGRAIDAMIDYGLRAETESYSNAAGEYVLSKSFLIEAFSLRETDEGLQYSDLQPITPYFLKIVHENSSVQPSKRLILEELPGDATVFMVRTTIEANRDYLPLLYCLGMIIRCPYADYLSSKMWIFKKEVLYLCAKVFRVLDFNISRILLNLMKADMIHRKNFCRPLWRVLMAIEHSPKEPERLSHIPRTAVTIVELSRFTELVKRLMQLKEYDEADINLEYSRILNLYDCKHVPNLDCVKAALMYERRHLRASFPQFIPKIKWIHKRCWKIYCYEAEYTLERKKIDSIS